MVLPLLAAAGALATRVGPYVAAALPMIQNLFTGGGPSPEKVAAFGQVRDGMVDRLMASEGLSRDRALAAVNEQLKPLIESGGESEGGGVGGAVTDAIGLAGAAAIGGRRGGGKARAKAVAGRKASMGRRPGPVKPEEYRGAVAEVDPGDEGEGMDEAGAESLRQAMMRSRVADLLRT